MNRRAAIDFGFGIALPAFLTVAATAAIVLFALARISFEINAITNIQTQRTVQSALEDFSGRLVKTVEDYAIWNDAVVALYGNVEPDFVQNNIVSSTATGRLFDVAFVVGEAGTIVTGAVDGRLIDGTSAGKIDDDIQGLLLGAQAGKVAVSGFVEINGRILGAAVHPIIPQDDAVAVPAGPPRYLVLGRHLTADRLATIGRVFAIEDLGFADGPAGTGRPELTLLSPFGQAVGTVTWTPTYVGDIAYEKARRPVEAILVLLGIVMIFLVMTIWKALAASQAGKDAATYAATRDPLSGLPNRAAFNQAMVAAFARPNRLQLAVVFVDLDGFKDVNDTYGHEVGDRLIRAVSAGFQAIVGDSGLLSRLGGDEFAVLFQGPDAHNKALRIGSTMIDLLAEPLEFEGRMTHVGASVGVAFDGDSTISAVELVRRADVAMYEAKARGKNRLEVYIPELDAERTDKVKLAAALRIAVDEDKLDVHYQPVVDAETGKVVSLEALVRWIRPGHGPISPSIFVPVAEEMGMIEEIGAFVLRRVCRDAAAWGEIEVSVNVSAAQFRNPGFDEIVADILREAAFPPQRLMLDITESYLVAFPDRAKRTIESLRQLGISVALDDFGTGFSSVSYLRRFAFDRLKIDRSMVLDIVKDPASRKLVEATIALADALGVQVTAEGIEHEAEAKALREAGCRDLQGYHFGSPTTPEEITRRLNRQASLPATVKRFA